MLCQCEELSVLVFGNEKTYAFIFCQVVPHQILALTDKTWGGLGAIDPLGRSGNSFLTNPMESIIIY